MDLIKEKKVERQIIFATHNANFVVNGDAECVHFLEPDIHGKTRVDTFTIETTSLRPRLLALEGGKEAFVRRERRYVLDQ